MMPYRTLLIASLILSACGSTPAAKFYALDDGRVTQISGKSPSVAITRFSLPELLDRPQLVIRAAGNQITFSEGERWATPLREEIPRLLANDLGELLNSQRVSALPVDQRQHDADFRLQIDILALDTLDTGETRLDLNWHLANKAGKELDSGRIQLREALPNTLASTRIAAHRRLLAQSARAIAERIPRVPL